MPGFHPRGCRKEDLADAGLEKNLPEPRRSKGVRNILTRGRAFAPSSRLASREPDSATAPAARDSATAPDSPPSLPARAQPPLALEKEFQVHRGSRRPHRFLPVWRETVATPGPEEQHCYFQQDLDLWCYSLQDISTISTRALSLSGLLPQLQLVAISYL